MDGKITEELFLPQWARKAVPDKIKTIRGAHETPSIMMLTPQPGLWFATAFRQIPKEFFGDVIAEYSGEMHDQAAILSTKAPVGSCGGSVLASCCRRCTIGGQKLNLRYDRCCGRYCEFDWFLAHRIG